MNRRGRAVGAVVATAAAAALCTPLVPSAVADSTVTVPATSLPDSRQAQLGLVGCSGLYDRGVEPLRPLVTRGVGSGEKQTPGLGDRSVALDLAGGNAAGPLYYRDSMLGTTAAGFKAWAPSGAAGVAYAGYQAPGLRGSQIWIGRASLRGTGAWTTFDATRLTYSWTRVDMESGRTVGSAKPVSATVSAFAADHGGDGAGFYSVGFGCDGQKFLMDAWRAGSAGAVTTWDLEGLSTTTTNTSKGRTVRLGQSVTLTATLADNVGTSVPDGVLVLESREAGSSAWHTASAAPAADGSAAATVTPERTTTYRWVFADRPLATGSLSAPVVIRVAPR